MASQIGTTRKYTTLDEGINQQHNAHNATFERYQLYKLAEAIAHKNDFLNIIL